MNVRMFGLLLVFLLIVSVFSLSLVFAVEDSWVEKAQMPTARFSFGLAVLDGRIYAIGGAVDTEFGEVTGVNEVYEPVADVWVEKEAMPTPRYGCAVVAYDGRIYVFGGASNNTYLNATEVYDPTTDSWETRTSMPTARGLLQANVVDDKIYLIGGYGNQTINEVYEPATDSWTTKSSIPTGVASYCSAVVDNKIIVISGTATNLTQIYDPQADTWSSGAYIPVKVYGAAVAVVKDTEGTKAVYVIGGETDVFSPQNITQIYFPKNNSWSTGASLPNVNSRLSATTVDNSIYTIGGTRATIHKGLAENLQYTPSNTIPEFPTPIILPIVLITAVMAIFLRQKLHRNINSTIILGS
jgi:N-acetylneuraminic acid mutarotase